MLDAELLRCPVCYKKLSLTSDSGREPQIKCNNCNRVFHVKAGVPIIWLDDDNCVKLWKNQYKDFVLSEETLSKWALLEEDVSGESKCWNRLQKTKKY